MKINLINILHILIIWQSLLFAIVLLTPKFRTRQSNIYLVFLLLTIGIHFSYNILYTNNLFTATLSAYSCSYGFLYGPLMLLYTRFYLVSDLKLKLRDWLHFIPFSTIVILTTFSIPVCRFLGIPLILVMVFYCLLSFNVILRYESGVKQVYSNEEPSTTRWIKVLISLMLIILFINFIQFQLQTLTVFGFSFQTEVLVQLGILSVINMIIYRGLKSPDFFQKLTREELSIGKQTSKPKADEEIKVLEKLSKDIDNRVISRKLYLDPDLTIRQLSEETGIHEKLISNAINTVFGCNFSEYINSYRIDHSLSLINSSKDLSIKEVMFQSGFNSRSVFNTTFKRKTGFTPSDYRQQSHESRSDF